ncbi:MAG: nanT 1 [Verrucomicrobia bacterium]|nr:nanT 1 [Verrucomicrobiota bacterium]
MHLYTLVALPLVVHLLGTTSAADPAIKEKSAMIQAAFLVGWAIGGAFFGRLGDLIGRSRALALTVLTYALCTGLCAIAQTWWQLMIFRFIAALGIGGEWAVGASLIVETWPKAWRPWLAAVLQSSVNVGILLATVCVMLLYSLPHPPAERWVFLIGAFPALLVFWIRRHVPETQEWKARGAGAERKPRMITLFQGPVGAITFRTTLVCALALSAWWLFLFWHPQHLRQILTESGASRSEITRWISISFFAVNGASIAGNFFAGWIASRLSCQRAIAIMLGGLALGIVGAFVVPRSFGALAWFWCPFTGFFSGAFGLFTMYLPPLFPTLLRTTGAGFCYNIGRICAAGASVIFGWFAPVNDFRTALLASSLVAMAAFVAAFWLPKDAT